MPGGFIIRLRLDEGGSVLIQGSGGGSGHHGRLRDQPIALGIKHDRAGIEKLGELLFDLRAEIELAVHELAQLAFADAADRFTRKGVHQALGEIANDRLGGIRAAHLTGSHAVLRLAQNGRVVDDDD